MSNRIEKVNALIKKELSLILLREIDFSKDALITVTRVEAVPNLSEAKIYISTMPDDQADRVQEVLKKKIYYIQQCLNKRLKMRPIPKIAFKKEGRTKQADRVEELLEEIKNKKL